MRPTAKTTNTTATATAAKTAKAAPRPRLPRALVAAAALTLPALATGLAGGCAASLRGDLEARPNGRFAASVLAPGRRISGQPPRARVTAAPAAAGQPAGQAALPPAPAASTPPTSHGPVTARELTSVGLDVATDALAAYQAPAWRPPATLRHAEARAAFLARSPRVAAAVEAYRGSFQRYPQVAYLNDLVRQYDAFAAGLRTEATTPQAHPDLAKRFPFHGVADLQGEVVGVDVALAKVRFEQAALASLVRFEEGFQGALYWERAVAILAENAELTRRVVRAARARYRAGTASHANLIQAQSRLEDIQQRLATARARRQAARVELAALLDLPGGSLGSTRLTLTAPRPTRPDRAAARAAARDHAPATAAARLMARRATLMVQLAERQLLPNLASPPAPGGGASLGPSLGPDAPRPRVAFPYATGGAFLRELRHQEAAARARLDATSEEVVAAADQAWVALDDALRALRINRGPQRQRAEQGVSVAERGYRAGTATMFDLDAAVQLRLRVALAARAATRDAFVHAARLRLTTGTARAPAPPSHTPTTTTAPREAPHE